MEEIYTTVDKLSRAGLDPTLPHFQLDFEKFSYLDFDQCTSTQMADLVNELHVMRIKKEKHRNSKSMIEGRINTYMENSDSDDEFHSDEEKK
jgi:hypothetical protein